MPMSIRMSLATMTVTLAAGVASAAPAATLDGFGPFIFDTALERVEARHDLEIRDPDGTEVTARVAREYTVIGYDFLVELVFERGKLRDIWLLSQHQAGSGGACYDHWENVFGALNAKYGSPDDTPSKDVSSFGADFKARFTVSQGRSIELQTDYITQSEYDESSCETVLTYRDRTGGSNTGF